MKSCPFCGVMPVVYDSSDDLKLEHKPNCFLKDNTWIVGERQINKWNTRFPDWISIDENEKLPEEFKVVQTYHVDDLYPVNAYLYDKKQNIWIRETEGPEDIVINGRNEQLYRPPTYWQPLPDLPDKI